MQIERIKFRSQVTESLLEMPVTALVGPRQSGKTTLARELQSFPHLEMAESHYFDLEDPIDLVRLENPRQALSDLDGLIIIDEVQRRPELFPILRVLADRPNKKARFLVLGSASGNLLRQSSESLAGRIRFVELPGFGLDEVGKQNAERLWMRGRFPRSFLAGDERQSYLWREDFIRTFLERDIPSFGLRVPAPQLRRFWQMAAHYHGQIWNHSEIARSMGQSDKTMRHYLDILTETFMVRQLQPWYNNIGKRLVKAPKFYLRDSGILHALLVTPDKASVERHPKLGASWEGFALEEVIRMSGQERNAYFWSVHGGAEVDLLIPVQGRRLGFEFKYGDAPKATRSMHTAMASLELDRIFVVYPGDRAYPIAKGMEAVPLEQMEEKLKALMGL